MSSARSIAGGLSERARLEERDREAIEVGIDLEAPADVEEVAVSPPPQVDENQPPDEECEEPPSDDGLRLPLPLGEGNDTDEDDTGLVAETWAWMKQNIHWYAISFAIHMAVFAALLLILGRLVTSADGDTSTFVPVDDAMAFRPKLQSFDLPQGAPEQPTELNDSVLRMPEIRAAPAEFNDASSGFRKEGGGRTSSSAASDFGGNGGFKLSAEGPGAVVNGGGLGAEHGTSDRLGSGGSGDGFAGRGKGNRKRLIGLGGGTKDTEVAVAAALNWFYRHRNPNGSWSLSRFASHCSGNPCTVAWHRRFRHGRDRPGRAAVSRRRRNAQEQRALSRRRQASPLLPHAAASGQRRSLGRHGASDVCPCPGNARPLRGLRHDEGPEDRRRGAAGRALHRGRPEPLERRLAICARRSDRRRHVGARMANHGPAKRSARRIGGRHADDGKRQEVARFGVEGKPARPVSPISPTRTPRRQ